MHEESGMKYLKKKLHHPRALNPEKKKHFLKWWENNDFLKQKHMEFFARRPVLQEMWKECFQGCAPNKRFCQ